MFKPKTRSQQLGYHNIALYRFKSILEEAHVIFLLDPRHYSTPEPKSRPPRLRPEYDNPLFPQINELGYDNVN
jgi:hypothetical protein